MCVFVRAHPGPPELGGGAGGGCPTPKVLDGTEVPPRLPPQDFDTATPVWVLSKIYYGEYMISM